MPLIETPRLVLRPQRVEDAAVFRQLWTERDGRVPPHRRLTDDGHPTLADVEAHIRAGEEARLFSVVRRGEDDVIGYCGLAFGASRIPGEPELAFELLRAVHNRGYATEAGEAVIGWASDAGHVRLWASVWEWNVASRRVLDKLGFVDSGQQLPPSEHGRNILTVRDLRSGARHSKNFREDVDPGESHSTQE